MVSGKLGLRMTTLHEETSNAGNQVTTPVHDEDEEKSDADYSEYDSYQVVHVLKPRKYLHIFYITYIRIVYLHTRLLHSFLIQNMEILKIVTRSYEKKYLNKYKQFLRGFAIS